MGNTSEESLTFALPEEFEYNQRVIPRKEEQRWLHHLEKRKWIFMKNTVQLYHYRISHRLALLDTDLLLETWTQPISVRLFELGCIGARANGLLASALEGYSSLAQLYGHNFKVTAEMIALNEHNEVKVWVNADFSQSSPQFPLEKEGGNQEETLVQSVLEAFRSSGNSLQLSCLRFNAGSKSCVKPALAAANDISVCTTVASKTRHLIL